MPATHLALLRGINLGGKNKLPMKDLAAMFAGAGCHDIVTYIQSGNVIFKAASKVSVQLSDTISSEIEKHFGCRVPVVLRTAEQMRKAVDSNPFIKEGVPENTLHVVFLKDLPSPRRAGNLDPDRSPPDVFTLLGQEIYLRLPNGMARTKLTSYYFDSKLGTIGTARNWRTVTKLLELMEE
ncbi:MAG: DUF1697 domain-containing protein [Acidobacteriaceae bacterium]|nr:DUF1697 domain-containing protein [Acidobacteriaceae bacterium]